jgi:cobalt-zinc-cadmium efflux system membrane fusion protein
MNMKSKIRFTACLFVLCAVASMFVVANGTSSGTLGQLPEVLAAANDEHDHAAHDEDSKSLEDHEEHLEHGKDDHDDENHGIDDNDDDDDHGGHDDHDDEGHTEEGQEGHEGHGDEGAMRLSEQEMQEFNITTIEAGPGILDIQATLPGEVRLNEDRLAHVVPRLSGIVREVQVTIGDDVQAGDILAALDSRELASLQSRFLAARERVGLAQSTYNREKELWDKQISAEKDFLEAQSALAESRIELRAAEQELAAIGLSEQEIATLKSGGHERLTGFNVAAPFSGTVIDKHITLGEFVEENSDVFTIADLSTVWVDLSVYQRDLAAVREGQEVVISSDTALPDAIGEIAYLRPIVGEETRTALARIILSNSEGLWRPGMFVTASIAVDELQVPVALPNTAIFTIEGKSQVFIQDEDGFEAMAVTIGRADRNAVEILSGIQPNQIVVATGGFHLKAEMDKEAFAHSGHAH